MLPQSPQFNCQCHNRLKFISNAHNQLTKMPNVPQTSKIRLKLLKTHHKCVTLYETYKISVKWNPIAITFSLTFSKSYSPHTCPLIVFWTSQHVLTFVLPPMLSISSPIRNSTIDLFAVSYAPKFTYSLVTSNSGILLGRNDRFLSSDCLNSSQYVNQCPQPYQFTANVPNSLKIVSILICWSMNCLNHSRTCVNDANVLPYVLLMKPMSFLTNKWRNSAPK